MKKEAEGREGAAGEMGRRGEVKRKRRGGGEEG